VAYEDWLGETRREALREGEQKGRLESERKGRPKGIAPLAARLYGLVVPAHFAIAETARQSPSGPEQTEEVQAMSNTTESPQPGSLEYFNRPENFLADTTNLGMEIVRRSKQIRNGGAETFICFSPSSQEDNTPVRTCLLPKTQTRSFCDKRF
jgi:hypothetical protein